MGKLKATTGDTFEAGPKIFDSRKSHKTINAQIIVTTRTNLAASTAFFRTDVRLGRSNQIVLIENAAADKIAQRNNPPDVQVSPEKLLPAK